MSKTKISVVIPCYNVVAYIREALESAFAQIDAAQLDVICVDNNSTDGTRAQLAQLSEKFPILVADEKKAGACAARNKGLALATGRYVQFLDADDLLQNGKLKSQLDLSQASNECNVVGAYTRLYLDGSEKYFIPESDPWKGIFNTRFGITSSLLLLKEDVEKAGGWNEEMNSSQEYELMFRMLKSGSKFTVDQNALTTIRERSSGQISQTASTKRWQRYLQLREDIFSFLQKEKPEYLESNNAFFRQSFFDLVRTVYKYEPEVAMEFFNRFFHGKFRPQKSSVTGTGYLLLHTLFGFPLADRIKNAIAGK